ncbi:hypothetical protein Zmor_010517 [Zophobas morio]|uniref:Uncharacterized protein n=1 Tax=Zophobas morio TaxID=2755281 RepID=A0AA38IRX4_9CUCU|nr:hypothetical protein Zmor_010517 [Zophobas morio]
MNGELSRGLPGRRRPTPIPVPPPRIPTPMPPSNNNNPPRSVHSKDPNMKIHPSSVGPDIPKLITKASYKLLDNDVKTAWINPRLISKVIQSFVLITSLPKSAAGSNL